MPETAANSLIVRTKLYRPPLPADFVQRLHLLEVFDSFQSRPLTLVSAAAGYGKSTLVSSWMAALDCQNAWLSLDESDNDLREFVRYLVAAIRTAFPVALEEMQLLSRSSNLPPIPVLSATLINELDVLEEPLVLVLDDVHVIHETSVNELLTELLTHPPLGFHMVLVGRRDPLLPIAKLRAGGGVTEIRVEQLRFTQGETTLFLNQIVGTEVAQGIAETWVDRTEGWVTGLRLAALALRGSGDVPSDPFQSRESRQYSMQYLLHEVLERQESMVINYLLKSSISDRFCASLCDALQVGGEEGNRTGMDGQAFIAWLEETGLFLIPLDAEHGWFRFHHLLQDLLRKELERRFGRELLNALHLSASQWFESESLVDDALKHALAAGAFGRAAELVERNRYAVMDQDEWFVLEKWLSMLPDSVVKGRPGLLLGRAWSAYTQYDFAAIAAILDLIDDLLKSESQILGLSGELAFFRGALLFFTTEDPRGLKYFEQALAELPESNHALRAEAMLLFCLTGQMEGHVERVTGRLRESLDDHSTHHPLETTRLLSIFVFIKIISGDTGYTERYIQRLRDVAKTNDLGPAYAIHAYLQGLIHLQRNELDAAVQFLDQALDRRHIFFTRAAVDSLACLIYAYQANGQADAADATLNLLREFVTSRTLAFEGIVDSCEARLALMQDKPEPAIRWLETTAHPGFPTMLFFQEIPMITRCRVLFAEGSAVNLKEAEERLREYAEVAERQHNTIQLIGILALQSMVLDKLGKAKKAQTMVGRALALAKPSGFVFPFLEFGGQMAKLLKGRLTEGSDNSTFIKQILKAINKLSTSVDMGSSHPSPTIPLTSRELEVLELLAQGLYQKEIAQRLFVSSETVKTHLKHIYRKLGVRDRRDAVKCGYTLELVSR